MAFSSTWRGWDRWAAPGWATQRGPFTLPPSPETAMAPNSGMGHGRRRALCLAHRECSADVGYSRRLHEPLNCGPQGGSCVLSVADANKCLEQSLAQVLGLSAWVCLSGCNTAPQTGVCKQQTSIAPGPGGWESGARAPARSSSSEGLLQAADC